VKYEHPPRYKCPECGSAIIWSLNNLRVGASSLIKCANNLTSSRSNWIPRNAQFCDWTGWAVRQKNGSVRLFHSDKYTLLREVIE